MNYKHQIIIAFFILIGTVTGQEFLKVQGNRIMNGEQEFILEGIGLGGWMLQEGYMFETADFANAEFQIKNKIKDVLGDALTEQFYDYFHDNFFTRKDVRTLAAAGFNSIRLAMHYNKLTPLDQPNVYIEKGFARIDSLLQWCKEYNIYLILDLHAAPGGQSDEGISDYDPTKPSLWESDWNKQKTIALWKEIARRYKNEKWIGGYDLINEPKWSLPGNLALKDLYIQITDAIRQEDTNHIVFIEGNWFATDFGGLTPPWDDNLVYSFHKYWNNNDIGTIQYLLDLRTNTGAPLWLGETGENSNQWFRNCVKLMSDNNIGWSWWTWKKLGGITAPLSAEKTNGYQTLLNYWRGSGPKPSQSEAWSYLTGQVDKMKHDNCSYHPDVVDGLFNEGENVTVPFKELRAPGIIYLTDYDMGPINKAYNDKDYQNTGGLGAQDWNNGFIYRNDGVDIESCSDPVSNGYNVGWIDTGEWADYSILFQSSGGYAISLRYAAQNSGGKILLYIDDLPVTTGFIDIPVTGGWQNWQTMILTTTEIPKGMHTVNIRYYFGGFNVNSLRFDLISDVEGEKKGSITPELYQNFPNPFNCDTNISFSLPDRSAVKVEIFDSLGEKIDVIEGGMLPAGHHSVNWSASNLPTGVYYYRLIRNGMQSEVMKLVLLK